MSVGTENVITKRNLKFKIQQLFNFFKKKFSFNDDSELLSAVKS